jgi:hypothetical protein
MIQMACNPNWHMLVRRCDHDVSVLLFVYAHGGPVMKCGMWQVPRTFVYPYVYRPFIERLVIGNLYAVSMQPRPVSTEPTLEKLPLVPMPVPTCYTTKRKGMS